MAEQPAAWIAGGETDAPRARAVDVRDAVVPGEPLVHEREVGVEEVDDAAVLLDDRAEEQLGLALKRLPQVAVEVRRIGSGVFQLAQEQPLAGEVGDERLGPRIRQHPAHLPFERPPGPSTCRAVPHRAAHRPGCCSTGRTTAATPARDRSAGTPRPLRRWRVRARSGRGTADPRARATRARWMPDSNVPSLRPAA